MRRTDLVVVPTPGMGHLLSAVEFAKLIVRREPHISVAVLAMSHPSDSSFIPAYVDAQSREADSARLTFVSLPIPPQPPNTSSIATFYTSLIELNKPLVKQAILDRIGSGSPKPAGLILDMFCAPMIDVANQLAVPSYIYFSAGANLLNLVFHALRLADEKGVNVTEEFSDPDKETDPPGFMNPVPGKVMPGLYLDKEGFKMLRHLARRFRETKGILVNTYVELESFGIQALLDQAAKDEIPAVYSVGPILGLDNKSRGGCQQKDHDSIMEWLDQQPPSSVVFLCFGSMGSFDQAQVKEIAHGLDRAGHRFLWSLRRPPAEGMFAMPSRSETFTEALPEGFLERTAQRGKIIGWAPQVSILAHRAIGGFVSHCGWNSTLESMWFGVPMATWPVHAEQQLNAFTLVKELGVALEIRMDYREDVKERKGNFLVTSEEVENGVKKLMSMDEETRERVREMGDNGRKAIKQGGSSHYWLGRFIADVLDNVVA